VIDNILSVVTISSHGSRLLQRRKSRRCFPLKLKSWSIATPDCNEYRQKCYPYQTIIMENTGDNEPPPEDAPPTHMSTSEEPPSKEPGTSIPTPPKPSPLAQSSSSSNSLHKELEELRKLGTVVSFGTKLRQRVKQKNSVNLADWNARLKKQKEEERRRQRESQEMLRRHHDHNAGMRQSTAQKTKTNRHSFESSGTRKWTGPAPVNARDCRDFKKDTLRDLFGAEGKKKFQDLRTRFITKKTESFGNVRVEVRRRKKNKGPLIKNNVDEKKVSGVVGVDGASESTDASEKKELLSPTITAAADAVEKADIEDSNTATTEEEDEFEYYEVGINDDGVEFEIETDEISSEEGPIEKLIMADEEKAVVLLEPAPKIRIPTPLTGKRLDPSVIPHHYDINYKMVDLIKFTFSGTVEIEIEAMENDAVEDRRSIILHSLGLDLTSASLGNDSTVLDCESFRFNIPRQTVDLLFPGSILPGFYKLSLSFSGILNDEMRGFYRSAYALNGEKRYMAVTKFEPTNARRAFPCFDEPIMKATYSLKVLVPSVDNWMLVAISNTPTSSIKTVSGGREYTFEKTPKMSSYLVALIVGEMDSIKVSGGGGVSTSVYVPPGRAEDGRFCLDVASKALLLYSKLYGVPYPLGKSDLIAVPDFASGAMENWYGLCLCVC